MFSFIFQAWCLVLVGRLVSADVALTTITPCPSCPSAAATSPITVTEQHQTISTCQAPTSTCVKGQCSTITPCSTYVFVSSTVPCAFDGTDVSSTVATATDQMITVSKEVTTVTTTVPISSRQARGLWFRGNKAKSQEVCQTVSRNYQLPYNQMGPLAMPGYPGNGICDQCGMQGNGAQTMVVSVSECTSGLQYDTPQCVAYKETWISSRAPRTTSVANVGCATQFYAPSAGYYTFNFPQTAPGATIQSAGFYQEVSGFPWLAEAVYYCGQGHNQVTTTVTSTLTWECPYATKTGAM